MARDMFPARSRWAAIAVLLALGGLIGWWFSGASATEPGTRVAARGPGDAAADAAADLPPQVAASDATRLGSEDRVEADRTNIPGAHIVRCVDELGAALAGALVHVASESTDTVVGQADALGLLALDRLAGSQGANGAAARYLYCTSADARSSAVAFGSLEHETVLVAHTGARISGLVLDVDRVPMQRECRVLAWPASRTPRREDVAWAIGRPHAFVRVAQTDPLGYFCLTGVAPDTSYELTAVGVGACTFPRRSRVVGLAIGLELALRPVYGGVVQFRDESGSKLAFDPGIQGAGMAWDKPPGSESLAGVPESVLLGGPDWVERLVAASTGEGHELFMAFAPRDPTGEWIEFTADIGAVGCRPWSGVVRAPRVSPEQMILGIELTRIDASGCLGALEIRVPAMLDLAIEDRGSSLDVPEIAHRIGAVRLRSDELGDVGIAVRAGTGGSVQRVGGIPCGSYSVDFVAAQGGFRWHGEGTEPARVEIRPDGAPPVLELLAGSKAGMLSVDVLLGDRPYVDGIAFFLAREHEEVGHPLNFTGEPYDVGPVAEGAYDLRVMARGGERYGPPTAMPGHVQVIIEAGRRSYALVQLDD